LPHAAHAAAADFRVNDIRPNLAPDQRGFTDLRKINRGTCQKTRETLALPSSQSSRHSLRHLRVVVGEGFEPLAALVSFQIKNLIEEPAELLPFFVGLHRHP